MGSGTVFGVPYGRCQLTGLLAPKEDDWVVSCVDGNKWRTFLARDDTDYRKRNNFVIKPGGPIWEKICVMYDLRPNRVFSASRIYHEMSDPQTSWQGHYSFAGYRADDSWHGTACPRYEMTPILDLTRLPEYHYLPYDQAVHLASYFMDCDEDAPLWLKAPDFYLPTVNIKHALDHDPMLASNTTLLQKLSDVIGVQPDHIKEYILHLEEQEAIAQGAKAVLAAHQDNLAKLTVAELKLKLQEYGVSLTRNQSRKADIIVALENELKRRNISLDEFMEDY